MTIGDETAERIVDNTKYIRDCLKILAQGQSLTKNAYLTDRKTEDVNERDSKWRSKRVSTVPVRFSEQRMNPICNPSIWPVSVHA
jgi:hypothetical protein